MAFVVTIDGVDQTNQIDWASLNIDQALTSQVDTCSFSVKTYGTKVYVPGIGEEIVIENDGTKLFAGLIQTVNQEANSFDALITNVVCKDYTADLDRILVVDSFIDKPVGYVINTIMNLNVNKVSSILASFESTESWVVEAGTFVDETTDIRQGEGAKVLATVASAPASAYLVVTEDLTSFESGDPSTLADLITFWLKAADPATVDHVRIRLTSDAPGVYTNYFELIINSGLSTGFNFQGTAKSSFTTVGAPSLASITAVQVYVEPVAASDASVIFDDMRMISEDGFTQFNVSGDFEIAQAAFNYQQVSQCLGQLAEQGVSDWYPDYDRDIHFFSKEENTAPFTLEDDTGNFLWDTFSYKADISQLRNQIIVRGGEFLGDTLTEQLGPQADGAQTVFQLGYKYDNVSLTLNAAPQTIGIKNVDDPTLFDVMFSFQEKVIEFDTPPTGGDTIEFTGDPFYPVIAKLSDSVSIAEFGVQEFKIVDKTIDTRDGAKQRARAELEKYKTELEEGTFQTLQDGLRTGQLIDVDLVSRGINESFLITRLNITMRDPSEPLYTATLITTKLFGMIEFLLNLLRRQDKDIVINPDEVLDLIETYDEIITLDDPFTINTNLEELTEDIDVDDAFVERALNDDDIWVAGGIYHPTDLILDRNRPPRTDVGAEAT